MSADQFTGKNPKILYMLRLRECLYDKIENPLFEDLNLNSVWPDIVKMRKQEDKLVEKLTSEKSDVNVLNEFYKTRRSVIWNWLLKNPMCEASPDDLFNKEVL